MRDRCRPRGSGLTPPARGPRSSWRPGGSALRHRRRRAKGTIARLPAPTRWRPPTPPTSRWLAGACATRSRHRRPLPIHPGSQASGGMTSGSLIEGSGPGKRRGWPQPQVLFCWASTDSACFASASLTMWDTVTGAPWARPPTTSRPFFRATAPGPRISHVPRSDSQRVLPWDPAVDPLAFRAALRSFPNRP